VKLLKIRGGKIDEKFEEMNFVEGVEMFSTY
jgi:hypothetical protein